MNDIPEKSFDENFKLKKELNNVVEELYITSKFPPLNDVSGIVLSKRIMKLNKKVDVVYANFDGEKDYEFNSLIDNFINERIIVGGNYSHSTVSGVNYFRKEGMKKLNQINKKYKTVVSRTWTLESHFLALDYKLQNPDVVWIAEFSDPMRFDVNNNLRRGSAFSTDEEYFENINKLIKSINIKEFGEDFEKYFPNIQSGDELYFLVEYLPFLFADVVRFTNERQQEIMLDSFPYDIKDFVLNKSEVSRHPTLDEEYYTLKKSNYDVNDDYLNFAYFGTYLGKRHLEYLFKSFEELTEEIRDKIKIHLFVPNADLIRLNLKDLRIFKNIEIGDKVPFLEFLNLTTKMDILIVNDLLTKNIFKVNPYLPSKFADYSGSGSDIWLICEKNSSLSSFESKYKSYVDNYDSSKFVLGKIIEDKLNIKEDIFRGGFDSKNYYQERLTNLNNILEDTYKQRLYWINQNNLSKNKSNMLTKDISKLNDTISQLNGNIQKLNEEINEKDEEISSLRNNTEKIENLKNEIISVNSEKKKLCDGYFELHEITKNSFELLETKDEIIQDLNKEIDYYHNRNILRKVFSSPLEYLYLFASSSRSELKLNYELFKLIKELNWVNKGYYLLKNPDVSRFKWVTLFSPELHYVCFGFDEDRLPNRETTENNSKKDLLKKLKYLSEDVSD